MKRKSKISPEVALNETARLINLGMEKERVLDNAERLAVMNAVKKELSLPKKDNLTGKSIALTGDPLGQGEKKLLTILESKKLKKFIQSSMLAIAKSSGEANCSSGELASKLNTTALKELERQLKGERKETKGKSPTQFQVSEQWLLIELKDALLDNHGSVHNAENALLFAVIGIGREVKKSIEKLLNIHAEKASTTTELEREPDHKISEAKK